MEEKKYVRYANGMCYGVVISENENEVTVNELKNLSEVCSENINVNRVEVEEVSFLEVKKHFGIN